MHLLSALISQIVFQIKQIILCFINICFTTSNSIYNQVIVTYFCDSLNSISIIGFICSRNGNKQMVSTATSSIL